MSLGAGVVCQMPKFRYIRNVEGSSEDPKIEGYSDWIYLWQNAPGNSSGLKCCVCGCDNGIGRQEIIGGHIVLGESTDMTAGAASAGAENLSRGSRVFIAPICKNCNGQSRDLWVQEDTTIVQLCGFMQDMTGTEELNQFAATSDLEGQDWEKAYEEVERKHRDKMQRILNTQRRAGLNSWDSYYLRRSSMIQKAVPSLPSNSSENSGSSDPSPKAHRTAGYQYGYGRFAFDWN